MIKLPSGFEPKDLNSDEADLRNAKPLNIPRNVSLDRKNDSGQICIPQDAAITGCKNVMLPHFLPRG